MNKQILTRSILLTLAMSTAIPAGQAWAIDEGLTLKTTEQINLANPESSYDGHKLSEYSTVNITNETTGGQRDFASVISGNYREIDLSKTDFIVNVSGSGENANGLHITGNGGTVNIGDFSGTIDTSNSDGISIGNEAGGGNTLNIGSVSKLIVNHGSGIRANAISDKWVSFTHDAIVNVNGETNITINGGKNSVTEKIGNVDFPFVGIIASDVTANGTYNPSAIYAGDDMYCFNAKNIIINTDEFNSLDKSLQDKMNTLLSLMESSFEMGNESIGKGIINLKGKTVLTLNGDNNYGLFAGKNGQISLNDDLQISSIGANSYGIAATNGNLTYGNEVNISGKLTDEFWRALDKLGFMAGFSSEEIKLLKEKFGNDKTIVTNINGLDESKNIHGTSVTLGEGKNVTIVMHGGNSHALHAEGVDDTEEKNQNRIIGDKLNSLSLVGDVEAENGGLIDLHVVGNDLNYLEGDVKAYGTESNKNATVTLSVDNALRGQGTIAAANGGIVNLTIGEGSNWTGRADDYGDANSEGSAHENFVNPEFGNITSGGAVNLTMGNDAVWNVDGQSWITNLTASGDNMFINLLGTQADRNANADALTIYNLKGHATFAMHLDGERSGSDMLYIKNTDGSSYDVYLDELVTAEDMYQNGAFKDGLRFATVGKGDVTFNVYSLNQGIYNLKYQVKQTEYNTTEEDINAAYNESTDSAKPGSDMVEDFFTSEGEPPSTQSAGLTTQEQEGQNAVNPAWNYNLVAVQDRQITDAGKTIIAMSKVNYSNAVYMDRLNKRMGEARYIDGDDGLWVRMRHDRIGKEDAFRSMNTMFELGYDWHAKGQKDGEHRQGVAFDYMRGTADYKNVAGDGDVRRAGVWLYDTWLGDKGHYSDYVVKYGRLSNDFDIYALSKPGEKISGDYDNDVWSVSAEYGRKKDIGNDWYFEPQVQAQYAYVTSADYTTSQGTKVSLDSIDSLIGRMGFRLGRDTSEGNTVYFKADVLRLLPQDEQRQVHVPGRGKTLRQRQRRHLSGEHRPEHGVLINEKREGSGRPLLFSCPEISGAKCRSAFQREAFAVGALFDERRSFSGAFCQDDLHSEALIFRRKGACYNTEGKTHSGKEGYL